MRSRALGRSRGRGRLRSQRLRGLGLCVALLGTACTDAEKSAQPELLVPESAQWAYEAAYVEKDDPQADLNGCSGVRVLDQGDFDGRVALSFDGGPSDYYTSKLLSILREHSVPATFFVSGRAFEVGTLRAQVQAIARDELFQVANHSWDHADLRPLDGVQLAYQIDRTNAEISLLTEQPVRYFRFPYGAGSCRAANLVRQRGMSIVGWHVESADWCYAQGGGRCAPENFKHVPELYRDDMMGFVLAQLARNNGGIVRLHDGYAQTAQALPGLVRVIRKAGYRFVGLEDLQAFPKLNGVGPPAHPFIGTACERDEDCDFGRRGERGFCHPAGLCSIPCAGECLTREGAVAGGCVADVEELVPRGPGGLCLPLADAQYQEPCSPWPHTVRMSRPAFSSGDAQGAAAQPVHVCWPIETEPTPQIEPDASWAWADDLGVADADTPDAGAPDDAGEDASAGDAGAVE